VAERDLGGLACETKGVLLGRVSLDAGEAAWVALEDEDREQCSRAWRALGKLEASSRHRTLATWRMQASSGLPPGIERLHPSWIEAALAGEAPDLLAHFRKSLPEGLRGAVETLMRRAEGSAEVSAEVLAMEATMEATVPSALAPELDRVAFGDLAPFCGGACGPLANRLCALDFEALHDEVIHTGARTLGRSLAGADAATRARAMALAGEPWAQVMAEAFVNKPSDKLSDQLSDQLSDDDREVARDLVATKVRPSACTAAERLLDIGLAALKTRLSAEHAGSVFRVAGRLPAALGRQLLDG
jgi:hypothetical protein